MDIAATLSESVARTSAVQQEQGDRQDPAQVKPAITDGDSQRCDTRYAQEPPDFGGPFQLQIVDVVGCDQPLVAHHYGQQERRSDQCMAAQLQQGEGE